MLADFIPPCPRLHPGMMVLDDSQCYDYEWVCRACGTRLYGTDPESAAPARISSEIPIKDETRTGRPRNIPTHYSRSKERNSGRVYSQTSAAIRKRKLKGVGEFAQEI